MFDALRFGAKIVSLQRGSRRSPERTLALQDRRLRRLLKLASEKSPHYREKFASLDLDNVRLQDIPTSNKPELMENFEKAVTEPDLKRDEIDDFVNDPSNLGKYFHDRYVVSHTSGSSGQPLLIVQQKEDIELLFALQSARGNCVRTSLKEAFKKWMSPARLAVVTLRRGFYPSACAFEYMPEAVKSFITVQRLSQTDDDVVEQLNEFQPTHLTAYASVLSRLVDEVEEGRLKLEHLTQIVNNSEALSDQLRKRLQDAFHICVSDNYASGECPFLTNGCREGKGVHVNADWAILEVVDDNYQPVPDGEPGTKVLVTNLSNTIQPFIRYEIQDVVTMGTSDCGCGSLLPRIEKIDGRATDVFWISANGQRKQCSAILIEHALEYVIEVREWQAEQVDDNHIKLKIEILPDATFNEKKIRSSLDRQLKDYGFDSMIDFTIEAVDRIEPDPKSNKIKRVLNNEEFKPETVAAGA